MAKDKALGENGAYWAQRMRFYEQACARKNLKITAEIDAAFSKANSDIERDLEHWYGRLAKNNGISLAAARRLLDAGELAEFKWSVDEYMAKARQSGNGRWLKELENASARVHISRLDAMKISMRNTLESAFGAENDLVTKMAAGTYRDAVRHTAADMEKLFKADFNIGEIDDEKIQKLIRKPWTPDARTFSDRIWAKKNEMINALQEELTRGCIYGRPLDETIARMEKFVDAKFKNAKYAARRIVVTESAYFRVLGTRDELAAIGVEEFQVDLPIGSHSCEICRAMNGRIFPMSEFAVGLNAPPFHPNCENGSIIPVMDEDFEEALGEARGEKVEQGLTDDAEGGIIESIDDLKINSQPHDLLSDLRDTNPNYSKGAGYKKNCANCVVAYELRRRGYDVEARPSNGLKASEILGMFSGFKPLGYVSEKYKFYSKNDIISDIVQTVKSWGNGSRGIVNVQWKNADFSHFFSVEVENGEVRFINPQDGGNAIHFFDSADILKTVFGRVDNLELTDKVLIACKNKG